MSHICVLDRNSVGKWERGGEKPFRITKRRKARLCLWSIFFFSLQQQTGHEISWSDGSLSSFLFRSGWIYPASGSELLAVRLCIRDIGRCYCCGLFVFERKRSHSILPLSLFLSFHGKLGAGAVLSPFFLLHSWNLLTKYYFSNPVSFLGGSFQRYGTCFFLHLVSRYICM